MFEAILAREFSDYRYGKIHRLTVDSYSLQHPDKHMRSGKSFAAHLTGMCAALEREDACSIKKISIIAVTEWQVSSANRSTCLTCKVALVENLRRNGKLAT